jgi:hypothetical protein
LEASGQSDRETYRVIVLGRNGTEVLLTRSGAGLCFPQVTIPRWQRAAEYITIAMRKEWGGEIICLFELPGEPPLDAQNNVQYMVTKHWRGFEGSAVPLRWIPVNDLREDSFLESPDYSAVERSLLRCSAPVPDHATGPFAHLSWFEDLCQWVGEAIASRGLHLNGNFRQLNASPGFSLVRFETDGPAVWFKAVGEPNQCEFPVTLALARLLPSYIPQVLAVRPAWNGWLMSEAEGTNLAETTDRSLWETAAEALAKLQIESMNSQREFVDCGAHDLRIRTLRDLASPFMDVMAQLMKKQSKTPPAVVADIELRLLQDRLQDALSTLGDLGIPDTLGHLDLNPGNLIVSDSRCLFLDWAEAYVGQPFFTFQYLLEHHRRMGSVDSISEERLLTAYLAPWEQVASRNCVEEAMLLAPLVAVFAYAVGAGAWMQPERLSDPKAAGYLRSLVRRMNREANELSERRSSCLS